MTPDLADHLLIFLIAIVYPVYSTLAWNHRIRPRLEAKEHGALINTYRKTIVELWILTVVILVYWYLIGRDFSILGLGMPGGWAFWVGVIVWVAVVVFFGQQISTVRKSPEARKKVREQFRGNEQMIVPRNKRERQMAVVVSLTAGICEEVIYRGFFITYLMVWYPGFAAVAISTLIFGVAHIYQGWPGVFKAMLAGAILGAAFLFTGSLWVPIALHATVDIASLLTGSYAIDSEREGDKNP